MHRGRLHFGQNVDSQSRLSGGHSSHAHGRRGLERAQRFTSKPGRGLRTMGRVYAGWALSQAFYREQIYREIGFDSLEDFLVRDWEASFLRRDAGNLLSMIETWKRSDISDNESLSR